MAHIFISYSHSDIEYVTELREVLQGKGFEVWFDERIEFGDRWFQSITNSITNCAAVIVVMSSDAEQSDYVEKEILIAQKYKKPIFPLLIEGGGLEILINIQHEDLLGGQLPDDVFFNNLRKTVERAGVFERVEHEGLVYISHHIADDEFVNRLAEALEPRGIEVFVDHRNIKPGDMWGEKVKEALVQARQMIAVVSHNSLKSRKCFQEWKHYADTGKEIIPLQMNVSEVFFTNAHAQTVKFNQNFDDSLHRLIKVLTDQRKSQITISKAWLNALDKREELEASLDVVYPLLRRPKKFVGIATGNIAELTDIDVIVNSENNNLRMDRSKDSVSSALNYAGARRNDQGELVDFTLDTELREASGQPVQTFYAEGGDANKQSVQIYAPATVLTTSAGALSKQHVRHILHVVSVLSKEVDRVFEATTLIQLGRCVTNALHTVDMLNEVLYKHGRPLKRIVFPILGTGKGKSKERFNDISAVLIDRAIEYLEFEAPNSLIEVVYFAAYTDRDRRDLVSIFERCCERGDLVAPVK